MSRIEHPKKRFQLPEPRFRSCEVRYACSARTNNIHTLPSNMPGFGQASVPATHGSVQTFLAVPPATQDTTLGASPQTYF